MNSTQKYYAALKDTCNEMRLDFFPQVQASDLLFKVITLEDIYMPLSLTEDEYNPIPYRSSDYDIDELIRFLNEKINKMEKSGNKSNVSISSDNFAEQDTYNLMDDEAKKPEINRTILIEADPGSGKTTFCKRLVLALINHDEEFFDKYSKENNLSFNIVDVPVLIKCRYLSDLSVEELSTFDFKEIMFRLCSHDLGMHYPDFTFNDFSDIVSQNNQKLCVILDGWDEILNSVKAAILCDRLSEYIAANPQSDFVITSRFSYVEPTLDIYNSRHFRIRPFSNDDVRCFCRKWYEILLSPDQKRFYNCETISNQILNSNYLPVRFMMTNPLELSLLLTVSKNDGLLPDNKSELFEELVDLYIYWNTNKKNNEKLSSKEIRVLLSYIATYFTKNELLYCDESQLLSIIEQALRDLEFVFSDSVGELTPQDIADELSHTGIFSKSHNGNRYSFSESNQGSHRQIQEYLTAYAIVAQYADEEYNNMSPIDILDDKYTINGWDEIVIFIVLMKNGRLRKGIINSLITKCSKDSDNKACYTNLLFSFIIMNADISSSDRHRIYDSVFKDQITNVQITSIIDFISGSSNCANDFVEYITEKYLNSISKNESDFSFAYAIIEASKTLHNMESPFEYAYNLICSKERENIIAGLTIITLFAWCKYEGISNAFAPHYLQYRMSTKMADKLKTLVENDDFGWDATICIKESIIAGYVSFYSIFDNFSIQNACTKLITTEANDKYEIILSLTPIFDAKFSKCSKTDVETQEKYLQKLKNEINDKTTDNIVFTFCICASIGCFSTKEIEEKWKEIRNIYSVGYSGAATSRYSQLDEVYLSMLYDRIRKQYKFPDSVDIGSELLTLSEKTESYAIYENVVDNLVLRIEYPNGKLSQDAEFFLEKSLKNNIGTNNNLAYLLRRNELKEARIEGESFSSILTPKSLLIEGVQAFTPISSVNYALALSEIHGNTKGNYDKGKRFLSQISVFIKPYHYYWEEVFRWWTNLSVVRKEYEGFVVLTWLYILNILSLEWFNQEQLFALSEGLQQFIDRGTDFSTFSKAIKEYMK